MAGRTTIVLAATAILTAASCGSSDSTDSTPSSTTPPTTTGITAPPTTAASPATTEAATVSALEQAVIDFVGDNDGGAEVLLRRDGETTRVVVGSADSSGTELTEGRRFRVGSISKPFVAAMVMQLVDAGAVDLDESFATYVPDTPIADTITVRELLAHKSGVADYTEDATFFAEVLSNRDRGYEPADLIDRIASEPLERVGEFNYSNTNYILLGQLVVELDGGTLNESLEQRITGPLGLDDTYFDTGEQEWGDLVAGWNGDQFLGEPDPEYRSVATSAWSAGSLVSTADDLVTFINALLVDRTLVSAASTDAMTDVDPEAGTGLGLFALGLSRGVPGFGHGGAIPGYTAEMAVEPSTGTTMIILTNNDQLQGRELAGIVLAT